jgi:hypothetical protein
MDCDRIRLCLEFARTGVRVYRQYKDANRARKVHSLFRIEEH